MKHTWKKAAAGLMAMALVVGAAPANIGTGGLFGGTSITAYADETETLLTTITATGTEQASYSTANVATVSFSNLPNNGSSYTANWGWWGYGWTATVTPVEGYTITKCVFYDDTNHTATDSLSPFVVETTENDKKPQVNDSFIYDSIDSHGIKKIEVYGYATTAGDTTSDYTYTLTIPATLAVANSGWNSIGDLTATGTLAQGKKLNVTATSKNSWKLTSGENTVAYKLCGETAKEKTYAEATDTTSLDISKESLEQAGGFSVPIGIVVEDYSSKPAGDYSDTVTFTAKVENAGIPVESVAINNAPTEALFVNSTGTLTATVSSDNATDKTVVWSSSDSYYVSINAETGEYTIMGTKGYGSATITATATNGTEDTSDDVTATCTITGKVTYTSLSAGTVLHVGDTFYAGKVYFNTTPAMSFQDSNGVITLVEDKGCYKFKRGSNGTMPNVTAYKIKDNTDGVNIVSGSGTTSDKFTLAVHTK